MKKMKLYQFKTSGNCYKIRLLLSQIQVKYDVVNLSRNESRLTETFLLKSPLGKLPVLETEEIILTESMAILYYLAKNTPLLPENTLLQSEILKWMSFEQSEIQSSIAVARYFFRFEKKRKEKYITRAKETLKILNSFLKNKDFLVGNIYTIADISLYAYVHLAPEADISLNNYPNIVNWLANIESQPNYIPLY
jgi:glutathione S-transferase